MGPSLDDSEPDRPEKGRGGGRGVAIPVKLVSVKELHRSTSSVINAEATWSGCDEWPCSTSKRLMNSLSKHWPMIASGRNNCFYCRQHQCWTITGDSEGDKTNVYC